jgi:hypothetical protein
LGYPLEPPLFQALADVSEIHITKVLEIGVHRADGRQAFLDCRRNALVFLPGQHIRYLAVRLEHFYDVLIASLLTDGIIRILQLPPSEGGLDALDDRIIALAIIDNDVAFLR